MTDQLHQDSLSELRREIDAITCEWCCKGFVLENGSHKIYCDPNRPEGYGRKCESKAEELLPLFDSIAAKAFEMAGQIAHKYRESSDDNPCEGCAQCGTAKVIELQIRALSPASARRQLQLDLINRAIEEAEWWEDYSRSQGFRCIRWERPGAECAHKSCLRLASLKSQRTQLESEIAALEAQ